MSHNNTANNIFSSCSKATVYLYKFEPDLIDLQVEKEKDIPKTKKVSFNSHDMATINIKLTDLLNNDLAFDQDKILLTPSVNRPQFKTENIKQNIDGMEYIERCKQRHANLMNQVELTRQQSKMLFLTYY